MWVDAYAGMDVRELSRQAEEATQLIANYIQDNPLGDYSTLFDNLCISEQPVSADAIFVFGSPADARIKKAVELYHNGYADKLILTGHSPVWSREAEPEAVRMQNYALRHGVPSEAVFVEPDSITLPDNVKRTIDDFEAREYHPKRIIIVASTYILRRAYMEWYKFTPWDIQIIPVSAANDDLSENLRRTTWHVSEKGVWMLLNEYAKIVIEQKMDLIRKECDD